ncbi:MAG: MBL fold metallo-hydrolase [Pseudomonadota bacterium]
MSKLFSAVCIAVTTALAAPVSATESDIHLISTQQAPEISSITRTSAAFELNGSTIFIDPVGSQAQYRQFGRPDIVVLTSANADHLSIDTMIGMLRRDTVVLAPQSVINQLPLMISNNVITPFATGSTQRVDGITFTALPTTANRPRGTVSHNRQRGEIGVVVEANGKSIYF